MSFANRISAWNRRRKMMLFERVCRPQPKDTILDIGFNEVEYSENDNYLEKHYSYPEQITALGIGGKQQFEARYPKVTAKVYDGKIFPFKDQTFDVAWSNAVLEHVGGHADQVQFLREIARVANRAFITTPNRHFPIEIHTRVPLLHLLLPLSWFETVLRWIGKGWATGDYMHLLSLRDLRICLKEAGITEYTIYRNRLGCFVLDFVVCFKGKNIVT